MLRERLEDLRLSLVIPLYCETNDIKLSHQAICRSVNPIGCFLEMVFFWDIETTKREMYRPESTRAIGFHRSS